MTRQLSLPDATRIEVISGDAERVFVGRFPAGVSVHLQDEGRTVKVFAGQSQLAAAGALQELQDAVAAAFELAPQLLESTEYGGTLVDVIAGHLNNQGFARNREV